jgi:2-dehydro-3-deoxyglucarate aldolase/4-hydroxy-2-oxoheptanedioate aldolase
VILGNAQTDYKSVNPPDFLAYANQNTTIICQIESVEGINNLEAIAQTPGVDILWVGHFDLTNSMGIPGDFANPRFHDALKRVVEVSRKYGLGAGIQPANKAQAQEWMAIGFNVISYSMDTAVFAAAMRQGVTEIRQLAG